MKKVGVVFLSIIFIVMGVLTLTYFNLKTTILSQNFYIKVLNETNVYERFLKTDPKFFVKLISDVSDEEYNTFVQGEAERITNNLKVDTVKNLVESTFGQVFTGVLKNKEDKLSFDLKKLKSEIKGDGESNELIESIPETYEVNLNGSADIIKKAYGYKDFALIILGVILVLFLLAIGALIENWRGRFKTFGIILFILSLPILITSIILLYFIPIANISIYPELAELVKDILEKMRDIFFIRLLIISSIITTLALILFVISLFLSRAEKDKFEPKDGGNTG
jgi:hypothetical protein